jgi:hypothetical protein
MDYLLLELKVCEACGVLWLRAGVKDGVYCLKCSLQLADFPQAKGKHPGGRRSRLGRSSECFGSHRKTGRAH